MLAKLHVKEDTRRNHTWLCPLLPTWRQTEVQILQRRGEEKKYLPPKKLPNILSYLTAVGFVFLAAVEVQGRPKEGLQKDYGSWSFENTPLMLLQEASQEMSLVSRIWRGSGFTTCMQSQDARVAPPNKQPAAAFPPVPHPRWPMASIKRIGQSWIAPKRVHIIKIY